MTRGGKTAVEKKCDGLIKPGSMALPVLGSGKASKIRKSEASSWRAISLMIVHVLMVLHVAQYLYTGRTVSPIEPSETMYTLNSGEVNAGAIFFAVALLSTLIFGRFFCGWGCHLVAYQDLCGWLMKKVGIRPQPFRSRLMLWIPFGVAIYMFVWPTFARWTFPWLVRQYPMLVSKMPNIFAPYSADVSMLPHYTNHLMTDSFWKTFPGPWFAVLTFVTCGFAIIYFMGQKGFCSYACPYGGFFAPLDKLSAGKILVTDACEQCGHCTATCTSNVRINEEVKRYGMVVDPGCMKCLDCVSVCPNDALYFGFGKPVAKKKPTKTEKPRKHYDLSLRAEVIFLIIFLLSLLSFRGIYDGPPLLMSLAMGAITAFLCYRLWGLVSKPTIRIQNLKLKTAGRLAQSGVVFGVLCIGWLVFTAHCGFVQYHRFMGQYYREQHLFAADADVIAKSKKHFTKADSYGLFGWAQVKVGLATFHYFHHEDAEAERYTKEALQLAPDSLDLLNNLVELQTAQNKTTEAIETLGRIVELKPDDARAHFMLASGYLGNQKFDKAIVHFETVADLQPDNIDGLIGLGIAYFNAGRINDAIAAMKRAEKLVPNHPQIHAYLNMFRQQQSR